jgi:hypothetical protein
MYRCQQLPVRTFVIGPTCRAIWPRRRDVPATVIHDVGFDGAEGRRRRSPSMFMNAGRTGHNLQWYGKNLVEPLRSSSLRRLPSRRSRSGCFSSLSGSVGLRKWIDFSEIQKMTVKLISQHKSVVVVRNAIETTRSDSYLKPHNGLSLQMQYFSRDNTITVNMRTCKFIIVRCLCCCLHVGKLMPRVYRDED